MLRISLGVTGRIRDESIRGSDQGGDQCREADGDGLFTFRGGTGMMLVKGCRGGSSQGGDSGG